MFKFDTPVIMLSFSKGFFLAQYDGGKEYLESFLPALGENDRIITLGEAFDLYRQGDAWIETTYHVLSEDVSFVLMELRWVQDSEDLPGCSIIPSEIIKIIRRNLSALPSGSSSNLMLNDIPIIMRGINTNELSMFRTRQLKNIKQFFEWWRSS